MQRDDSSPTAYRDDVDPKLRPILERLRHPFSMLFQRLTKRSSTACCTLRGSPTWRPKYTMSPLCHAGGSRQIRAAPGSRLRQELPAFSTVGPGL